MAGVVFSDFIIRVAGRPNYLHRNMINKKIHFKENIEERKDFLFSKEVFDKLVTFMEKDEIQKRLKQTHILNANSSEIQDILLTKTNELGFKSEKTGLFKEYPVKQLRPDYFLKINSEKGIIIEVERGKTIANNMDLLDLWKCHICRNANFLFLVVPNIRPTAKGRNIIFKTVVRRMDTFFKTNNYTNVDAVFILGY